MISWSRSTISRRLGAWGWLIPAFGGVVVLLLPALGLGFNPERQITLVAILTLIVSGLNLSFGYAGELALGQVAVYAAGAYVAAYASSRGLTDIVAQLALAGAAAVVVGIVTAIPGLRLGGWSLAMTSFFLVLLVPDVLALMPQQTGGSQGFTGIRPATFAGRTLGSADLYLVTAVVTILWLAVLRNLVTTRHGTALRILRKSPVLAGSMGVSVYQMKLKAYALGALPSGLAGCLFANLEGYLSPDSFGFSYAVIVLAASLLGGSASVYGAIVGAAVMQLGPFESTSFNTYAPIAYGGFLLVCGVAFSSGIAGLAVRLRAKYLPSLAENPLTRSAAPAVSAMPAMPGTELRISEVSKSFGGNHALSEVTIAAKRGEITALIGPNGSGKTTLLNLISGYYRLDRGQIMLGDTSLRHRAPHQIARAGVARTFQTPLIPEGVTVGEFVSAGRYESSYPSMLTTILRLPAYWRGRRDEAAATQLVLQFLGLDDLIHTAATSLPLGTRRQLELARALIARPRLLLLDEAASGLDEDEIERFSTLLRMVRDAGATVLLVEHDFDLVLKLADRIHVMTRGVVLSSGTPSEIESNDDVVREYLGTGPHDRR